MKFNGLLLMCMLLVTLHLAACGKSTVVLLEGLDGKVGQVIVTPREGTPVNLTQPQQAVVVSDKTKAEPVFIMPEQEVQKKFGGALGAEPEPPVKFMLYFGSESTALLPESKTLLPKIVAAMQERHSTDISVIGHTDRAGDKQYNLDLSRKRAESVAKALIKLGMPSENMEINSHGENNPIVPTADGVHKRINRRVEVTIR